MRRQRGYMIGNKANSNHISGVGLWQLAGRPVPEMTDCALSYMEAGLLERQFGFQLLSFSRPSGAVRRLRVFGMTLPRTHDAVKCPMHFIPCAGAASFVSQLRLSCSCA